MNRTKTRLGDEGMALTSAMILTMTITIGGLALFHTVRQQTEVRYGFSKLETLDQVMVALLDEAREIISAEYDNDFLGLMGKISAGNALLEGDQAVANFDSRLGDYTYNYYLVDNDDHDSNAGLDSDGRLYLEVRVYFNQKVIRKLQAFVQIETEDNYPPETVEKIPFSFGSCFDLEHKNFNIKIDLLNGATKDKKIYVNGDDHDEFGVKCQSACKHENGVGSNGTFGETWYSEHEEDLIQVSGLNGIVGTNAVLEQDWIKLKCRKYTNLETTVKYQAQMHEGGHEVVKITPETSNYDLSGAKMVVFDASGGGRIVVAPATPGGKIVLGSAAEPLIVLVKGKYPRCTMKVAEETFCSYAGGDGVVEFAGSVEGNGIFMQDSSIEVSGDFSWTGYVHVIARDDQDDPNLELGRVMEIKGNSRIIGGLLFNKPKGFATLGDLDPDPFTDYAMVVRGEQGEVLYSEDAMKEVSKLIKGITSLHTAIYSMQIQ